MTDKTPAPPETDPEMAKNVATIRRGVEARVADIKRDLAQWIDETTSSAEHTPVSIALLETAIDRYLAIYENAANVSGSIQAVLRRVVRKRAGSLQ
jgi:hypothetical protein